MKSVLLVGAGLQRIAALTSGLASGLAATSGATLRELMDRMGHSSSRAALVYLHGSAERQEMIADAISEQVRKHMPRGHMPDIERPAPGSHRARSGHGPQE